MAKKKKDAEERTGDDAEAVEMPVPPDSRMRAASAPDASPEQPPVLARIDMRDAFDRRRMDLCQWLLWCAQDALRCVNEFESSGGRVFNHPFVVKLYEEKIANPIRPSSTANVMYNRMLSEGAKWRQWERDFLRFFDAWASMGLASPHNKKLSDSRLVSLVVLQCFMDLESEIQHCVSTLAGAVASMYAMKSGDYEGEKRIAQNRYGGDYNKRVGGFFVGVSK